ncbi:MAG: hypothetical protein ACOZQL_29210 [Myxococcota bacterium]
MSVRLLWLCLFVASTAVAQTSGPECVPACRSGYFCHEGQCLSRCNPPCPQGTTCLDTGECSAPVVAPAPASVAPQAPAYVAPPPAAPSVAPVGQRVNHGWATGAGVLGVVSAALITGFTAVTIAFNGNDIAKYSGAVTLLYAGISIPIVAVGAGSGRWDPSIRGGLGWRIVGWVTFGLAMANGVIALGLGLADFTVPSAVIASLGGLGVLSALSHGIDAFITGGEGRTLAAGGTASTVRAQPLFLLARDSRGGVAPTVGWAVAF